MKTETKQETTLDQLRAKVIADQAREVEGLAMHDCIAGILRDKFNGKKINKRIEGYFRERYYNGAEAPCIHYDGNYLYVWGGDIPYDKRKMMHLGYERDMQAYDPEVFEDRNVAHGQGARERIAARKALLAHPSMLAEIAACVEQVKMASASLDRLTEYETPGHTVRYDAQGLAGLK